MKIWSFTTVKDEEDIIDTSKELLKLNNKELNIESFKIENNKVYLNVSYQVKGIISNIVNIKLFDINNKYEAYRSSCNDNKHYSHIVRSRIKTYYSSK